MVDGGTVNDRDSVPLAPSASHVTLLMFCYLPEHIWGVVNRQR